MDCFMLACLLLIVEKKGFDTDLLGFPRYEPFDCKYTL